MADTTYRSVAIEALPTPDQFDVALKLVTEKLDRRWIPKLRFTAWLMDNATKKMKYNAPSVIWDLDPDTPPYTLQRWGKRTEINAVEYANRRRAEVFFDYFTASMPRDEITQLQTGDVQSRKIFAERFVDLNETYRVNMNAKYTAGAGTEYTVPGGSNKAQEILGYKTLLATSLSGTVAQIAVSGNTFNQWAIENGDSGTTGLFQTDVGPRVESLLRKTCVDRNGVATQADTLFTGLTGLGVIGDYLYLNGMARLNFTDGQMKNPGYGTRGASFQGVEVLRDETIATGTKRMYALNSESWFLASQFGGMIDIRSNLMVENFTGKDTIDVLRSAQAMWCDHLPSNGVLYWA